MTCPTTAAHALLLPLHPSFMSLGAFAPLNGPPARPPLWTSGRGCGDVEGEAGTLFTRPPCWPAEAGGGPRVIARHYIDKICCPRYGHLAGRSLRAAGRHATCKLAGAVAGGRRRGMQVQKRIAAGGWNPGKRAQLVHRNDCFSPLSPLTASQHRLYDFEKVGVLFPWSLLLPKILTANKRQQDYGTQL